MKKLIKSLFAMMLIAAVAIAQERTVTGTVTSAEDGLPLPGVSVAVKGTTEGTQTDGNGKYSLKVNSEKPILIFSFIGTTTRELAPPSSNLLNVKLVSDAALLNEVVVVGYGSVRKESFTGSAAIVKNDVIANRPVSSFEKTLQGAVAGVNVSSTSGQPGAATAVRIRGIGSITAGSSPLYVIDGIPVSTGNLGKLSDPESTSPTTTAPDILSSLNPNDIESITVLKDASAASIYGSRAANGVILITTKKGLSGVTKLNVSATTGFSEQAVRKHKTLNASEYFKKYWDYYYQDSLAKGGTASDAALFANSQTISSTGLNVNPFNTPNPYLANGILAPSAQLLYDTDWRDAVIGRGYTNDINISAQGGNEATKFFISGGVFDQKGIVLASDFKRYSAKINVSNKVNKWLNIGVNSTLSYSDQNSPAGAGGGANPVRFSDLVANVYSLYQRDASGVPLRDLEGNYIYNYSNPVALNFNPVGQASKDEYNSQVARGLINPYAEIKFLEYFTFKTNLATDFINNKERLFYNPLSGNGIAVKGRGGRFITQELTLTTTNTLTYDRSFGEHNFNLLLGQEAYKRKREVIMTQVTGYPFDGVDELIAGSTPSTASSYIRERRLSSYFSRLNYSYNDKYYFSGSLRRDGSSVFGVDERYGTFYSLGGAWRISKEDFLKDYKWINELKIRASYGTSGNDDIAWYAAQGLYGLGFNYQGQSGTAFNQLPNPLLRWEDNDQLDIGIELSAFNGRLNGEVSYYNRNSEGLLFDRPLSFTTGFENVKTNLANMSNSGVDILVGGEPVRTDNFSWNISVNLTTVKNKIKKLSQNSIIGVNNDATKRIYVGGDLYQFYLREYAGVDPADGSPMWYTDEIVNGQPTGNRITSKNYSTSTRYDLGSALPKFTGGLTNRFRYKEFDLSTFLFFSYGGKIYDNYLQQITHNGITKGTQLSYDVYNAWTPSNTQTSVSRFNPTGDDLSNNQSSRYLFDGSYMRLKNIALGYTVKRDWISRAKLSYARVFVNVENAFTLAKHKGMDPEVALSGLSINDVPNVRTFSLGINVGF